MFGQQSTRGHRRSAFPLSVESVERRELLSISNFSPVGPSSFPAFTNEPLSFEYQVEATHGTKINVKNIQVGTHILTKKDFKLKITKSSNSFQTIQVIPRTPIVSSSPGTVVVAVNINGHGYGYIQEVEPLL
jgi:hypothetical protein